MTPAVATNGAPKVVAGHLTLSEKRESGVFIALLRHRVHRLRARFHCKGIDGRSSWYDVVLNEFRFASGKINAVKFILVKEIITVPERLGRALIAVAGGL